MTTHTNPNMSQRQQQHALKVLEHAKAGSTNRMQMWARDAYEARVAGDDERYERCLQGVFDNMQEAEATDECLVAVRRSIRAIDTCLER